jgi:PHD/YefM family antitoxin component YafN of YafNO toxin-antitoxin module
MKTITANELKTKGIAAINKAVEANGEATITVRGQDRYVVMDFDTYNRLRVCELEAALHETRREVAEGRYVEESVEDHIKRISRAAE